MTLQKEMSSSSESITPVDFSSKLKNYSRMVSEKLELNRQSAGKLVGMSAATCAALTAHQSAEAAIRYSGPVNAFAGAYYTWSFNNDTISIDGLANFGISAAWFPYYSIYGLRQVGFGTTGTVNSTGAPGPNGEQIVFAPVPLPGGAQNQPDMLAAGATIDANSPWFAPAIGVGNGNKALIAASNYQNGVGNWPNPAFPNSFTSTNAYAVGAVATGFAGIRFDTAGGNAKHNGWVRLLIRNTAAGGFTAGGQVSTVQILDWAYETTPDAPITVPDSLVGDYNGDGVVDAADYTVWRDAEGENFLLLNEDPNATTVAVVDGEDYTSWESQFGASTGSSSASAVPEPSSATVLSLGLLATGASGIRRQRRAQQCKTQD